MRSRSISRVRRSISALRTCAVASAWSRAVVGTASWSGSELDA
jgi:hypothetical protein